MIRNRTLAGLAAGALLAMLVLLHMPTTQAAAGSHAGATFMATGGSTPAPAAGMPDTVHVAEGREFNLWYDQFLAAVPGADFFTVAVDCGYGAACKRSWRLTPDDDSAPEVLAATVKAVDPTGAAQSAVPVYIQTVPKDAGTDDYQALFIGDSLLADGEIVAEVYDLVDTDGGANLAMLGTQGSGTDLHEGYSGKGIRLFRGEYGPFWDTDGLNFQSYMTNNSFTGDLDFAVIQLGYNDLQWGADYTDITTQEMDSLVFYTKELIAALLDETTGFPDCRVIISLQGYATNDLGAFGASYAGSHGDWWLSFRRNVLAYSNRMLAEFDRKAYADNVDVCATNLWVDREYGYEGANANVSSRSTVQERTYTNYLHPNIDGNEQMADAIYSAIRWGMYSDVGGCTNELANSWQFTNASYWTQPAGCTRTAGQADPWGGTSATLMGYTATTQYVYQGAVANNIISAADVVCSIFVKNINIETTEYTTLRVVDTIPDPDVFASARINWTTTPTSNTAGSTITCNAGVRSVGDGWYQLWVHFSGVGREGHTFNVRHCPNEAPEIGDAMYVAGMQLEYNVTEPCADYVQTPEN